MLRKPFGLPSAMTSILALSSLIMTRAVISTFVASAIALSLTAGSAFATPADEIKEASKLYQQNRLDAAMTKVNAALAQTPKDALGRFLKANIFIEQKRVADAIQVLTGLTEDFPELPEPYNNLAALYASQGNYEKAKAALELAIHTNPSYATAHENLGDIYAQLARREYDKALSLDKGNATAQSKLALVKDLFAPPRSSAPTQVAKADPIKTAPAVIATPTTVAAPTPPPAVTVAAVKPNTPPMAVAPPVVVAAKPTPAPVTPTAVKPAAPVTNDADAQITALVRNWTSAWSAQDVQRYLAFYAPNFEAAEGVPRKDWEAQRKQRIEAPSSIKVDAQINKITVNGNEATVTLRQSYRSNTLNNVASKTLKLVKSGDRWMIRSERSGS
jgi:tetratricopeptide (TPR) repeat protein